MLNKIVRVAQIAVAILIMPFSVLAANDTLPSGGGTASTAYTWFKSIVNGVIAVVFALMVMFFIVGVFEYVRAGGEEKALEKGKKHMIWGIIGMAIAAGAWGIVQLILSFLGLDSSNVPVNIPKF